MSAVGYAITTEAVVSLSAGVAKTVIAAKAHANSGLQLKGYKLSFDGITAAAVPVLIEIVAITFTTNSPGTNSTNVTPRQKYGRQLTAGFTGARNWTTEPTTITVIEEFTMAPDKGVIAFQYPLGDEPDTALAEGLGIRVTAPAAVGCRGTLDLERI